MPLISYGPQKPSCSDNFSSMVHLPQVFFDPGLAKKYRKRLKNSPLKIRFRTPAKRTREPEICGRPKSSFKRQGSDFSQRFKPFHLRMEDRPVVISLHSAARGIRKESPIFGHPKNRGKNCVFFCRHRGPAVPVLWIYHLCNMN